MIKLWTPTGQKRWDATCSDLLGQLKICWELGGQPLESVEGMLAEAMRHAKADRIRAAIAWEAAASNALDYKSWVPFMDATLADLRRLTGEKI